MKQGRWQMKPESKLMRAIFGEPTEDKGDDNYYSEINGVSLHDALMEVLDGLKYTRGSQAFLNRYKRVILLRFGFGSHYEYGKTFEQIGIEFGVTRERIRQIEAKTLRLLRHPLRARKLEVFIKR